MAQVMIFGSFGIAECLMLGLLLLFLAALFGLFRAGRKKDR